MPNPYATGNNIYRGGSPNATSGQVDPMGYVGRELNNNNGQRRSQLAQTMLQNMRASPPSLPFQVSPKHVSLLAIKMLGAGSGY